MLPNEPLSQVDARKLVREILANGQVSYSMHAKQRMVQRSMTMPDVANVLRGGWCDNVEEENGTWRYRMTTTRMAVVVAFRSETHLHVVTAMRIGS